MIPTFHSRHGFHQLQPIQLHIMISIILSEVLHQQGVIIQGISIDIFLLYVGLQVSETNIRFVSSMLDMNLTLSPRPYLHGYSDASS